MKLNFLLFSRIELNKPIKFKVTSSEPIPFVMYNVFAKGMLYRSRKISMAKGHAVVSFEFDIRYAPELQILVYFVKNVDGSLVSTSLVVPFRETLPNYVSLNLSSRVYSPGEDLNMTVKSIRSSFVSLLAVDQSVLLMKQGNDISKENVFNELFTYELNKYYWEDANTYFGGYFEVDPFEYVFSVNKFLISFSKQF